MGEAVGGTPIVGGEGRRSANRVGRVVVEGQNRHLVRLGQCHDSGSTTKINVDGIFSLDGCVEGQGESDVQSVTSARVGLIWGQKGNFCRLCCRVESVGRVGWRCACSLIFQVESNSTAHARGAVIRFDAVSRLGHRERVGHIEVCRDVTSYEAIHYGGAALIHEIDCQLYGLAKRVGTGSVSVDTAGQVYIVKFARVVEV